jgi:hypothetical protein
MAGFFSRLRGGSGNSIDADLKRITDSDNIDVPKDVLMSIVQASHSVDDRREIMKHLRTRLAEPEARNWRRIYGGLVLVEQLLQRGSRALMTETAEGHHFDLVQRLTFLENFEFGDDKRVQAMVRQKATVLRTEVISRVDNPGDTPVQSLSGEDAEVLMSLGGGRGLTHDNAEASPGSPSTSSTSPTAPKAFSKGNMIVNGLVSVGHQDDTDTESEGEKTAAAQRLADKQRVEKQRNKSNGYYKEHQAQKRDVLDADTESEGENTAVAQRLADKQRVEKQRNKSNGFSKDHQAQKRDVLDESTDSDSSSRAHRRKESQRTAAKPAAASTNSPIAPYAETVDLLAPVAPSADTVDLLGM